MPTSSSSSSSSSPPSRLGRRAALFAALADWARTDGKTWSYIFKAVTAALLALGVSLVLDLPQPRTALLCVFVVMQPQSGAVFAKSTYRLIGSLFGLVVMLGLIGLFAQQPELFILSMALWIGICAGGAARQRNFRSYGFVLAGYTAALIGLPAAQAPNDAFMTALTRMAELSVGILSAGIVSAVIFPQYSFAQIRSGIRRRFSMFIDYVSATLSGQIDREQIEVVNERFIADVVSFEATRSVAIFESPDARLRGGRLARLNSEFMTASTRLHALHQLMNRLRSTASAETIAALEPYFHEIAPLLTRHGNPVQNAEDAVHVAPQLEAYRAALPRRVRETRAALEMRDSTHLLDFDTATELLYRFVHELHEFTSTYASLDELTHEREHWHERYQPKTSWITAVVAGARAAFVTVLLGAFWIATAWPSGPMMVLNAAATCAIASSSPNPTRMATQMTIGSAFAALVGLVVMFGIFPHIDGFPLLCVVLAPVLAAGAFITTRPKYAGIGAGFCIYFCFLTIPDKVISYAPSDFINNALAIVMAMAVSAVAFAVLLPPSTHWLTGKLVADLRRRVVLACRARLHRLRGRFESGARDLMFQINALPNQTSTLKRDTLRWLFSVLEVGNAVIDLRGELATLPAHERYGAQTLWREAIDAMFAAISALFVKPDAARYTQTINTTDAAIAQARAVLAGFHPSREERRQLLRILSHLHFIRTALLDPQSPLGKRAMRDGLAVVPQGKSHAT
jgi:uncharacterized membrane protein YccC